MPGKITLKTKRKVKDDKKKTDQERINLYKLIAVKKSIRKLQFNTSSEKINEDAKSSANKYSVLCLYVM